MRYIIINILRNTRSYHNCNRSTIIGIASKLYDEDGLPRIVRTASLLKFVADFPKGFQNYIIKKNKERIKKETTIRILEYDRGIMRYFVRSPHNAFYGLCGAHDNPILKNSKKI